MGTEPLPDSDIEAALAKNLRLGYMEVAGVDEAGEVRYCITPKGWQRIRKLMTDAE